MRWIQGWGIVVREVLAGGEEDGAAGWQLRQVGTEPPLMGRVCSVCQPIQAGAPTLLSSATCLEDAQTRENPSFRRRPSCGVRLPSLYPLYSTKAAAYLAPSSFSASPHIGT